jgi:hypothetical protein
MNVLTESVDGKMSRHLRECRNSQDILRKDIEKQTKEIVTKELNVFQS